MSQLHQQAEIAKLAERYGKQVFHSAYRLLGDTHLAEDITQDVFIKLFSMSSRKFNAMSHWPGYLKSMSISTAIDLLRKQQRRGEMEWEEVADQQGSTQHEPFHRTQTAQELTNFRCALSALKTRDAEIFCLRHIEGYSYQEIAELHNLTTNAVGVTLNRAQSTLSARLGERELSGEHYAS
ncbi:RNA polymerase sigma factor [Alteromonas oceanisediminis]|uniref:RNA polymerase sigma factor n=1 Tax=Alteromonas oceanisediminis TaxID=2836180 RepID=UPI001BDABAFA|nr:sigma-70 family RNA polymerase sigma factor [Alteromonas oceanisediminis]MBT0585195.1 sigma-70 family RNA polymerase sigma factor [Alteromonas oceanisediminis]